MICENCGTSYTLDPDDIKIRDATGQIVSEEQYSKVMLVMLKTGCVKTALLAGENASLCQPCYLRISAELEAEYDHLGPLH
jgi:hypothetical protein